MATNIKINASTAPYCYLDFDIDNHRSKLATCAAFVNDTDSRYGFSSKDLRLLGGSEIARIPDLISTDHEWNNREIECKPPLNNRVVVKLFWDVAPIACENFATLCANGGNSILNSSKIKPAPIGECGKPLTYRGSKIHRILPGFILQGGDFVFGNGSGGESIYNGKKFKDERNGLLRKHDSRGVLSMGNAGKNSNSSQFFIAFDAAPQCDGKHVVFGRVVSGFETLDTIENKILATNNKDDKLDVSVIITDCGVYYPFQTPGAGYWYDKPDAESYSGISPAFIVRPRIALIAPSAAVMERFQKTIGTYCIVVKSIIINDGDDFLSPDIISRWITDSEFDIMLFAPACKSCIPEEAFKLQQQNYSLGEVILETKPITALKTIHEQSWLTTNSLKWQLDWKTSSSK